MKSKTSSRGAAGNKHGDAAAERNLTGSLMTVMLICTIGSRRPSLYTDENMRKRMALKVDGQVVNALRRFWGLFKKTKSLQSRRIHVSTS